MAIDRFQTNWRWVVTFSAFSQLILTFGILYCYSILFLTLQDEFHSGAALTGSVGSMANSFAFLMSPLSTLALRRVSCRVGAFLGIFTFCTGLICSSFATELWQLFLTFGGLVGFATNLSLTSSVLLICKWFPGKYNNRALAFFGMGSPIGMLVMGVVFPQLLSRFGWRVALRILSGVLFVSNSIAACIMSEPGTPTTQSNFSVPAGNRYQQIPRKEKTQDDDTVDGGDQRDAQETPVSEREKLDPSEVEVHPVDTEVCLQDDNEVEERLDCGQVLRYKEVWLWAIGTLLADNAYTFALVNIASFIDGLGFSDRAALIICLFAAGESCSKLTVAIVGDHLPFYLFYLKVGCSLVAALVSGLMITVQALVPIIIIAIVFGMSKGGYNAVAWSGAHQLFRQHGDQFVNMVATIPCGVGVIFAAPISGGLYDATGNYNLSLCVIVGFFVSAMLCFLLIPVFRRCHRRMRSLLKSPPTAV